MNNDYDTYQNYDSSLFNEARSFLHDSEQVLWIGKPCQSAKAPVSPFTLLFSFFWLGFAIFWTVTATATGGIFGFFGIPFICIGVYLLYTVTVGNKNRYRNTVYVVTDKRAMIVYHGNRGSTCNDYFLKNFRDISLTHVNGNVGTICFKQFYDDYDGYYHGRGRHRGRPIGYEHQTSFIMIDNVHEVYRIISERIS